MKQTPNAGTTAIAWLAILATTLSAVPANAQIRSKEKGWNKGGQPEKTQELPKCTRSLGSVAIQQPERDWWTVLGLGSPEPLLKLMVARSNCFRVVERSSQAMAMRDAERGMAKSGELRRGSNMGGGLARTADYILIPDIVNKDSNAGGSALGAIAGGLIGGGAGALLGNLRTKKMEAHTLISLVNARTTEQEFVAEGTASKSNMSFGVGGFFGGGGGAGAAGGGAYSDTDLGRVVTAAYLDAFVELVNHLGGPGALPEDASAAAGQSSWDVDTATQLRADAAPTARVVREFRVGAKVYPTGQKRGVWWEVDDETGNRGWILSTMLAGN